MAQYIELGRPAVLKELDDSNGSLTYKGNPIGGGSSDDAIKYPANKGQNGYVLSTNGNNVVNWVRQSGGGGGSSVFDISVAIVVTENEDNTYAFCEDYLPEDIYALANSGELIRAKCTFVYFYMDIESQEQLDAMIESFGGVYKFNGTTPVSVDTYQSGVDYYVGTTSPEYLAQFPIYNLVLATKQAEGANAFYQVAFSNVMAAPEDNVYAFYLMGITFKDGSEISTYISSIENYYYIENDEYILDTTIVDSETFNASKEAHGTLYYVNESSSWVLNVEPYEILTKAGFEKEYPNQNEIKDAYINYDSGNDSYTVSYVYAGENHSDLYVFNHLLNATEYQSHLVTIKANIIMSGNVTLVKYLTLASRQHTGSSMQAENCEMHFSAFEIDGSGNAVLYDLKGVSQHASDTPTWSFTKKTIS